MDTESEPLRDLVKTEAPESPYMVASPTSLPDSTPLTCRVEELEGFGMSGVRSTSSDSTAPLSSDHPLTHTTPALVSSLRRTTRMAMRVPPTMSPFLFASIVEVAAMSNSAFRKRFRSSYDSLPSSTLPVRKRYRGTSELILEIDSEGDELGEEDDEEVEENLNSDSESDDAKDEGPIVGDEGPTAGDEGLDARDGGLGMRVKSLG
nr:hypothetical protein [Tanacetum cinerariifolium]